MDGASALGYEQTTLRAFIFVGVGNEKCVADYVAQLLPSMLFSLTANNFATKWGAAAGILVGVAVVTYLPATGLTLRAIFPSLGSLGDFNIRIVALLANVVVLVAVSLTTRTSTATDKAGASPDLTLKASRRGRS
jgi:Na+/proline symporter